MSLYKSRLISLFLIFAFPVICHAGDNTPLTFGLFPYAVNNKVIAHHKKLLDYLEEKMGRAISLRVPDDMSTFVRDMEASQYDIIFSPPHVARHSELKLHYQRIAMTTHIIRGIYVVHKDSQYKELGDLRDKTIMMASPLALLSQGSIEQLRRNGLIDKKSVTIKTASSHKNAIFAVLNKEAEAAVTGIELWKRYPDHQKKYLKILAYGDALPGFMVMGSKEIPVDTINKLRQSLLEFKKSPAADNYIFTDFKPISDNTMQQLDSYIRVLK